MNGYQQLPQPPLRLLERPRSTHHLDPGPSPHPIWAHLRSRTRRGAPPWGRAAGWVLGFWISLWLLFPLVAPDRAREDGVATPLPPVSAGERASN